MMNQPRGAIFGQYARVAVSFPTLLTIVWSLTLFLCHSFFLESDWDFLGERMGLGLGQEEKETGTV